MSDRAEKIVGFFLGVLIGLIILACVCTLIHIDRKESELDFMTPAEVTAGLCEGRRNAREGWRLHLNPEYLEEVLPWPPECGIEKR